MDLPPTPDEEDAAEAGERLRTSYTAKLKAAHATGGTASLFTSLWAEFGAAIMWQAIPKILAIACRISRPFLLHAVIRTIEKGETSVEKAVEYALAYFCLTFAGSVLRSASTFGLQRVCLTVRHSLTCMIYQKAVTMSHKASVERKKGEITSLVSVDCPKIVELVPKVHEWVFGTTARLVLPLYVLSPSSSSFSPRLALTVMWRSSLDSTSVNFPTPVSIFIDTPTLLCIIYRACLKMCGLAWETSRGLTALELCALQVLFVGVVGVLVFDRSWYGYYDHGANNWDWATPQHPPHSRVLSRR